MFQFLEIVNGMEIYEAQYCGIDYKITYNQKRKEIEQILPDPGTGVLAQQFKKYKEG